MPSLTDIPVELFLENLLPILPVSDLMSLASTNEFFATLCSDDTFWKRRLQSDFNFSGAGTARRSGWKFIYQRLFKPRVYIWGEKNNGRLGLTRFPKSTIPAVPFPTQLNIPGSRIVSLIAGGTSFHALDSEGNVHVWGTLDGSTLSLRSDGFSESGKTASTPLKLQLPVPTRTISCGRTHSSTLDYNNDVWIFLSWGRPIKLSTHRLATPDSTPILVECGWTFTAVLTKSGEVFVWWPFSDPLKTRIKNKNIEMDHEGGNKVEDIDGIIPCVHWQLEADPFRLPPLPSLPDLGDTDSEDMADHETQIVRIVGMEGHAVALTNRGHVVKFGPLDREDNAMGGRWEYLPRFSELQRVREHSVFSEGPLEPPTSLKITHISAQFRHFIAYSTGASSVVLMGDELTTPDSEPSIISQLQYKDVISVVVGDYHYGAVTLTGKLLTWGAYSSGAIGLGDPTKLEIGSPGGFANINDRQRAVTRRRGEPPRVEVPTEVRFDHGRKKPKDRFCIAATAAGWHTGALVIDLEPNENDEDSGDEELYEMDEGPHLPRRPFVPHIPGQTPPILPGPIGGLPQQEPGDPFIGRGRHMFRIGYAGRGLNRGRGRGSPGA